MRLFILSGHFLFPAELDPWTGARYNFNQEEAFQHQWNLLLKQCYGANSASRVLNADGLIRKIVNNFRYLSFSFSPRLLNELRKSAPNVYRKIQEADRESLKRLGHGNALAQPYYHVILPLASDRDRKLQLLWGIQAFEHHFGRKPEGFYLPEHAVSASVLDDLVDLGIRFILLSCSQAEGTMPLGSGSWIPLNDQTTLTNRPLRIDRPQGSLVVFFHHPYLSANLSQYLKNSDHLCEVITTILQNESPDSILSISVNGEMFGKIEPFSDMCLAALWDKFSKEILVANYGLACELYLPQELVKLKKGENEEGTSLSCTHGVRRWKDGCACAQINAESSQTWKLALRTSITELKDSCEFFLEESLRVWKISLEEFQLDIIPLVSAYQSADQWFDDYKKKHKLDPKEKNALLEMALIVQHSQAMMESQLWHQDSPFLFIARSGLLQALCLFELMAGQTADDWEFGFLQKLENVQFNKEQNLADAIRGMLFSKRRTLHFPAALFLLDRLFRPQSQQKKNIGHFRLVKFDKNSFPVLEQFACFQGHLIFCDERLAREFHLDYLLVEDAKEGVSLFLSSQNDQQAPQTFDLPSLPIDDRQEIVQLIGRRLETLMSNKLDVLFPLARKELVYSRHLHSPALPMAKMFMELALTRKLLALPIDSQLVLQDNDLATLESELEFAFQYALSLDKQRLEKHFSQWIAYQINDRDQFAQESTVRYIEQLLQIFWRWNYQIDFTVAQLLVYEAVAEFAQQSEERLKENDCIFLKKFQSLIKLAEIFQIETKGLKAHLAEP